jgi:hypothetical protein
MMTKLKEHDGRVYFGENLKIWHRSGWKDNAKMGIKKQNKTPWTELQ